MKATNTNSKSFKWSNLNKSTPAKWVRIGLSLNAVSAAISTYGLTAGVTWLPYAGLLFLVVGTFITNMFSDIPQNTTDTETSSF